MFVHLICTFHASQIGFEITRKYELLIVTCSHITCETPISLCYIIYLTYLPFGKLHIEDLLIFVGGYIT